jgi:hypothetical protein
MSQAANTQGLPLDITDVFSTYLYTGNGSTQTITNDIDLAGEGGLVWQKIRTGTYSHSFVDTERGGQNTLQSNGTDAQVDRGSDFITSFNSDGFSIGADALINQNGQDYASWTFRKASKFFDVVTYTGDGVAGREIAHNLGSVPGCIIVKCLNNVTNWAVYHRGVDSTAPEDYVLRFNDTTARVDTSVNWNDTAPTSTNFTVGTNSWVNRSGDTYVAYLFAHNDGDGEFGPDGDQDIIKCGSYTGNGSTQDIDLGFEPQFVLIKRASGGTGSWLLHDTMRGIATGGNDVYLQPHLSNAEVTTGVSVLDITSTGFHLPYSGTGYNASSSTYIYIAIRRGPLAPPESATEVFDVSDGSAGASGNAGRYRSGFTVDMGLERDVTGSDNWEAVTRMLQGTSLRPNDTTAEDTGVGGAKFDYMDGWNSGTAWADSYSWMWKRAPSFFDVVAYTGDGTGGGTAAYAKSHNLGVVPEMYWVKNRNYADHWLVYHKDLDVSGYGSSQTALLLNGTNAAFATTNSFNTDPTDTAFYVGSANAVNKTGDGHIAYLFATLAGVSKVGSFSHTYGGTTNVDCGFTSGARFVLWKRTDGTRHWEVFDTARGIVAGNDAYLRLSDTIAETSGDYIDPYSAGFSIGSALGTGDFIFYAIA